MPRDDLSIDFVKKMPPVELLDPAMILDDWVSRTANLPEEIRFMQEEITEKDRQYDRIWKDIEDRDGRIQKWIRAHGSHQPNPKEDEYRTRIRKNYDEAEKLSKEKMALTQRLAQIMDKHLRHLDMQIKNLYDRNEPGFTDPDELPSLLRPSAANITPVPIIPRSPPPVSAAAGAPNNTVHVQAAGRSSNPQIRNVQVQQLVSASAPGSPPAAGMILNRQARENSAGPGSGAPKRGPRLNMPALSSGLARHSSLGPGTPKTHQTATDSQRAGSAGPRASTKSLAAATRRSTPSGMAGRKRGTPSCAAGGPKSSLSRVKRAAKKSPSSNVDNDMSDGDSGSGDGSDTRGTPAATTRASSQAGHKEGSHESRECEGGGGGVGPKNGGGSVGEDEDDVMDIEDDEAGDDKKYCLCQNVSFGDMVACDNDDCPYEWFHWSCVGLLSEPNGTWYCPECRIKVKSNP